MGALSRVGGEKQLGPRTGSFAALIAAYKVSPEWISLSPKTKIEWTRHLNRVENVWGTLAVAGLEPRHVLELRDHFAATPATANNLLRALSSMLSWSVPRGWRMQNTCVGVKKIKAGAGYEPWNWSDIELFQSQARQDLWLAAALALYTGQRQSDVLSMLWSDIRDGLIAVVQSKTKKKLWIPVHADLRLMLQGAAKESVNILINSRGVPWTVDGFKTAWTNEMRRDALKPLRQAGRVFHGLRKSAVVFLLEAGSTDAEVAAITGQSRQMVEHYARQVNQKKLAAVAVLKWEAAEAERHGNSKTPSL